MPTPIPAGGSFSETELLALAQSYLRQRRDGLLPSAELEAAWRVFHEHCSAKIRAFAGRCGALSHEIVDCVQDVWAELTIRLPSFQIDPNRAQFESWLYCIVRSKAADQRRARRRSVPQQFEDQIETMIDHRVKEASTLEENDFLMTALSFLAEELSACSLQVLRLRLVEQLAVAEIAEALGITNEQVWYRFHRARRRLERVGAVLNR